MITGNGFYDKNPKVLAIAERLIVRFSDQLSLFYRFHPMSYRHLGAAKYSVTSRNPATECRPRVLKDIAAKAGAGRMIT